VGQLGAVFFGAKRVGSTQANKLFACEKNSPAVCDNQGKATLTGCGVEELNAASCFLENAADPTLKSSLYVVLLGRVAAASAPMKTPRDARRAARSSATSFRHATCTGKPM